MAKRRTADDTPYGRPPLFRGPPAFMMPPPIPIPIPRPGGRRSTQGNVAILKTVLSRGSVETIHVSPPQQFANQSEDCSNFLYNKVTSNESDGGVVIKKEQNSPEKQAIAPGGATMFEQCGRGDQSQTGSVLKDELSDAHVVRNALNTAILPEQSSTATDENNQEVLFKQDVEKSDAQMARNTFTAIFQRQNFSTDNVNNREALTASCVLSSRIRSIQGNNDNLQSTRNSLQTNVGRNSFTETLKNAIVHEPISAATNANNREAVLNKYVGNTDTLQSNANRFQTNAGGISFSPSVDPRFRPLMTNLQNRGPRVEGNMSGFSNTFAARATPPKLVQPRLSAPPSTTRFDALPLFKPLENPSTRASLPAQNPTRALFPDKHGKDNLFSRPQFNDIRIPTLLSESFQTVAPEPTANSEDIPPPSPIKTENRRVQFASPLTKPTMRRSEPAPATNFNTNTPEMGHEPSNLQIRSVDIKCFGLLQELGPAPSGSTAAIEEAKQNALRNLKIRMKKEKKENDDEIAALYEELGSQNMLISKLRKQIEEACKQRGIISLD